MGIFDRFPYSSTHEMNLDFMLGKATEIAEDMQTVTTGMAQVQAGLSAISEKTEQATQAAAQAAQSASSIEGSVTAAEEAAEEAQMHNESAQTWANNALTYKADCQRSATEAAASSSSAAQAATAAAASEDTVAQYAQAANASAQSAANNNDSAHQYANQASASASNATFHSSNAQTAATNAQTAATNANTSATNASASADRAATLKTDVETLHRMCVTAVDQAAEQAVAAGNSAGQAAATKTEVENLVESLPEDFTDLNNTVNQLSDEINGIGSDVTDLKSAFNDNVLNRMAIVTPVDWHNSNADTTGYAMQADGTVVENSSRFYSDFIPVNEGDTVYQFYFSGNTRLEQYRRNICCFDANKQVVSGGNNSSQTAGFSVPSGVSHVRITCDQSDRNNIVFTVNNIPATRPSPYFAPYYKIINDFLTDNTNEKIGLGLDYSKFACSFPKQTFRMTVGIPEKWYYSNAGTPTHKYIWIGVGSEYSKLENDCISFPNNSDLDSEIYYRWNQYTDNLTIIDTQGGDAQYGLARHIVSNNLANCSCIVIGDSTVDHDTMTAKMLSYFTEQSKTLTLLGTLGSDGNYNEGRAGWKASDYLTDREYEGTTNPFYNPTSGTFDFSYYMTNQGYSSPDFVVLQLGINDLYYTYADGIESTWLAIKAIIDSILEYNNSIKILLNLPTPPNADQSKLSNVGFLYRNAIIRYARYAIDQAKTLYGDTKVRPTYCHLILDPATEIRDDVHPTVDGYNKMALEVVNQINCWQNGK